MSKKKFKQAVLLIHGIGDQRPMSTLRSFVEAVLNDNKDQEAIFLNKPQQISDLYELRRYTIEKRGIPKTHFYEFYWAHLMLSLIHI